MALAVEAPAREDLSFRTNDDQWTGARWWHKAVDDIPVVIAEARFTLHFDEIVDAAGVVLPAEVHVIDSTNSTTPGDPVGWFDATLFSTGVAMAMVPHTIWSSYVMRRGDYDLVAVGEGVQRCLKRGMFIVEEGIST